MLRTAGVVVLLVVLVAGCRGEEKPLYTVEEGEGLLAQAALVREDLRVVLPEIARGPHARSELTLAAGLLEPQVTLNLLEQSKALLGYSVDFDSSPTATDLSRGWVIAVHEELVLHNSQDGAALWLDYAYENRDSIEEQMLAFLTTSPETENAEVENVPAPLVGDDAYTLRVSFELVRDARRFEVVQDLVFFRVGPISAVLILMATRDREPILLTIVENAAARVALSLEQGPPPVE